MKWAIVRKIDVLVLAMACALAGRAAEPDLWRFVHPSSTTVAGLDWTRLRRSDFGGWLKSQWMEDPSLPGAEFLDNVREVLISSPGPVTGLEDAEAPLLIAVRGDFDLARVRAVLERQGCRPQMFAGVAIYRRSPKADPEPSFALLNEHTILVGDMPSLYATLERSRLPIAEMSTTFLSRAKELAARYDGWALLSGVGATRNPLLASMTGPGIAAAALSVEAGMTVNDGLSIDAVITVGNDRAARALLANLSKLARTAVGDKTTATEVTALLQRMRVTSDRSTVSVSIRMNPLEVARELRVASAETPKGTQLANAVLEIAPPPPKRMIRIEGLDEGSREIPFDAEPPADARSKPRPGEAAASSPSPMPPPDAPRYH